MAFVLCYLSILKYYPGVIVQRVNKQNLVKFLTHLLNIQHSLALFTNQHQQGTDSIHRKKLFYIDLSSLQACRQSIFIFLVLTINFLSSVKAVELRCRISTAFSYAFNGRNSSVGEVGLPQEDDWWLWMCQKRLINVKTILFFQSWFWSYSYFS